MSTKTSPCIVQFAGGPSDGLVLSEPHFETRDKLQMPAAPAFVRCGQQSCFELVGYWSTAYRLTGQHQAIEAGRPTTCLRYDFLGYELLTRAEHESARRGSLPRPLGLRAWFSRLRRKFVDWMLEPIEYPLKVSNEEANFGQRA
jgi:hypothetical protein